MKAKYISSIAAKGFIILSGISFLSVSIMAFIDPQSVMDLVSVELRNSDAYSSIRGVYGGVGLAIFIALIYKIRTNVLEALGFLTILWGLYAISRLITISQEGALGAFGRQWLAIECTFCIISAILFFNYRRFTHKTGKVKHQPITIKTQ